MCASVIAAQPLVLVTDDLHVPSERVGPALALSPQAFDFGAEFVTLTSDLAHDEVLVYGNSGISHVWSL